MATRTDPVRIAMALGALWLVGAGFAWRDLRQPAAAEESLPAAYDQLPDVLRPLGDSSAIASDVEGSIAAPVRLGARDPFNNGIGLPVAESQESGGGGGSSGEAAPVPQESPWTVGAIMPGRRRAAVINDALVYVGTVLPGGWTLSAVEDAAVVLTDPKGVRHRIAVQPQGGSS